MTIYNTLIILAVVLAAYYLVMINKKKYQLIITRLQTENNKLNTAFDDTLASYNILNQKYQASLKIVKSREHREKVIANDERLSLKNKMTNLSQFDNTQNTLSYTEIRKRVKEALSFDVKSLSIVEKLVLLHLLSEQETYTSDNVHIMQAITSMIETVTNDNLPIDAVYSNEIYSFNKSDNDEPTIMSNDTKDTSTNYQSINDSNSKSDDSDTYSRSSSYSKSDDSDTYSRSSSYSSNDSSSSSSSSDSSSSSGSSSSD